MNVYENVVSCIEVEDVDSAVRHYEEWGCGISSKGEGNCRVLDCPDGGLRVCPATAQAVTTA